MSLHPQLIRQPAADLGPGYTPITREAEEVGFDFGILRLRRGESHRPRLTDGEGALLLMSGSVRFDFDGQRAEHARGSLFDEGPTVLHACAGTQVTLQAISDAELAVLWASNANRFEARLFHGDEMLEPGEQRGQGLLDDAAHRIVRTVFHRDNRPESNLVLGEVVTFPGRWSSYPPHHHPQPEIYHYRFTEPRGYGHGELGHEVLRIQQLDTVKILDGQDHAQVAAPGYGMYYLWAIRHLPDAPYTVPEFAAEHAWLNDPAARFWHPLDRRTR